MMSTRRLSNPVSQPQAVAEPYRVPVSESLGLVAMIVIILPLPFLYDLALATGFAR